jgi:PEP-CTERM motif
LIAACAATVMIQGLGLFSADAPTNAYAAPNESFAFSFDLQSPVTPFSRQGANLFTTGIMDFTYSLDGLAQAVTLDSVEFETNGFALVFDDQTKLDFVGADLRDRRRADLGLLRGLRAHAAAHRPFDPDDVRSRGAAADRHGYGGHEGSVPEPASWALLIAGFGATGAVLGQRRRRLAEA